MCPYEAVIRSAEIQRLLTNGSRFKCNLLLNLQIYGVFFYCVYEHNMLSSSYPLENNAFPINISSMFRLSFSPQFTQTRAKPKKKSNYLKHTRKETFILTSRCSLKPTWERKQLLVLYCASIKVLLFSIPFFCDIRTYDFWSVLSDPIIRPENSATKLVLYKRSLYVISGSVVWLTL